MSIEKKPLDETISQLSKELSEAKVKFESIVQEFFSSDKVSYKNPDSVIREFIDLRDEYNKLQSIDSDQIEKMKNLDENNKVIDNIISESDNSQEVIRILDLYTLVHDNMSSLEDQLHIGNYEQSNEKLTEAYKALLELRSLIPDVPKIIILLTNAYKRNASKFETRLVQLLSEALKIYENSIEIETEIKGVPGHIHSSHPLSLHSLWNLFKQRDLYSSEMIRMANQIHTQLLQGILNNGQVIVNISHDGTKSSLAIHKNKEENNIVSFDALTQVFEFLYTEILLEDKEGAAAIGHVLWEGDVKLAEILQNYIKSKLPSDISLLDNFKLEIQKGVAFEKSLVSCGYISTTETYLSDYLENLEDLWFEKRRENILSDSRQLLLDAGNDSYIYDYKDNLNKKFNIYTYMKEVEFNSKVYNDDNISMYEYINKHICPSPEKMIFPKCKISQCIYTLISSIYDLCNEATTASEERGCLLINTTHDILALYMALRFGSFGPLQANLLLYNDYNFIIYHLFIISYIMKDKLPDRLQPRVIYISVLIDIRQQQIQLLSKIIDQIKEQTETFVNNCMDTSATSATVLNSFTSFNTSLQCTMGPHIYIQLKQYIYQSFMNIIQIKKIDAKQNSKLKMILSNIEPISN
ncbi:hypothetical protein WA158_001364 [Blastocystis sp. Blastoise]